MKSGLTTPLPGPKLSASDMAAGATTIRLTKERLESLLDTLDQALPVDALSIGLTPGTSLDSLRPGDSREAEWLDEMRSLTSDSVAASETGAVFFWSSVLQMLIIPPFPITDGFHKSGFYTSALRNLIRREPTLGVLLLRMGGYSVGLFRGQRLVASKTGTRYVKGRHSAGGTSQGRFARVREKQIHYLYVKVCSVMREKWEPYQRELDHIFLGGERHTLTGFIKECPFIQRLEPLIAERILTVGEPRRRELDRMPRELWMSKVLPFKLPEGFSFSGRT